MDKTLLFGERQDDETSQTRSRYCLEIIRCIALTAGRDMLPASLFAPGAGTPCSHRTTALIRGWRDWKL